MGKSVVILILVWCCCLFSHLSLAQVMTSADSLDLQERYYKRVNGRSFVAGSIVGAVLAVPFLLIESPQDRNAYGAGAVVGLVGSSFVSVKQIRRNSARKLGIPEELAKKWDEEYPQYLRDKRQSARREKD